MDVDCAWTSSARRKDRRLRSWRHERMTDSSPKGGWPGATHDALRGQRTASSGGRRPDVLKEPEPPNVGDRVQRHIVEQTVVSAPGLQFILDCPVPQMVDQLLSLLAPLDSFVPEQVIEVPKISTPSRCPRTVLSVPQTAEQLVEVPTFISYSREARISERIVEQTVSPSRDERISERTVEQFVDIPVHGRGASSRGGP